ncbi:MAG TPA: biopolymer transporter ExbD [Gammaproteobacteria bacterium]|nr:biopolymer transporter ExbD [Gammaproteobacteria bacterium]
MLIHRARRERHKEQAELNITAFMNLMVILVPFLLITAVFSRLAVIELNLPSSDSSVVQENEPELRLEITVRESRIEVGDRSAGTLSRIDNTAEGYDLDELSSYLQRVKRQFPDKADATILLEQDIQYDVLVQVMDTVRVFQRINGSDSIASRYELFPEISIGDAPVPN